MLNKIIKIGILAFGFCAFSLNDLKAKEADPAKTPPQKNSPSSLTELSLEHLTELPLENLMDIKVVSAAKKEQTLAEAAAAVYVLDHEDIRRSGAVSLPELLRMVPGVQVTRSDAQTWSVTARGFSQGLFANKMLVLVDGRAVYSPLFAGVFWDVQEVVLENIARIEVIRGPGGALWGANAVNGIINIISKSAKDTQGALIAAGGGLQERVFGVAQYGDNIGEGFHWRAYAKYFNRDNYSDEPGNIDAQDEWYLGQGGFRADWQADERNSLTFQGRAYGGDGGFRSTRPIAAAPFSVTGENDADLGGGHFLTNWTHRFDDESRLNLLAYYDRTFRDTDVFKQTLDTVDIQSQYDFQLGGWNAITVGAGVRMHADDMPARFAVVADDSKDFTSIVSGFVQDEISLLGEKLRFTLGSKFERNSYSGFEIQPTGRALYTPHPRHALWAAVSRAVRTPSRVEDNTRLNGALTDVNGTLTQVALIGNPAYGSEEVIALETGYRFQPTDPLTVDLAAFLNFYDRLRTIEAAAPFAEADPLPHAVVPFTYDNMMSGRTYGAELALHWRVVDRWRLIGTYSYLNMAMDLDAGSTDPISEAETEGSSPDHMFHVRSLLNLPYNLEFDAALYFTDRLPSSSTPRFARVDARLGWRPSKKADLSLVAQNLFDARHPELVTATHSTQVDRAVYGKFTFQF